MDKEQRILYSILGFLIGTFIGYTILFILVGKSYGSLEERLVQLEERLVQEDSTSLDPNDSLLKELNEEALFVELVRQKVKYPHIVFAQAMLETGGFTSDVCKNYNNLFGLYNSRTKDYYKFDHWIESVTAYKDMIQYRYGSDEEYYSFLKRIGYAEDPKYITKLKKIVAKLDYGKR